MYKRQILGADTMVVCGGGILGKPRSAEHARQMLRALSGRWHEVMTALALFAPSGRLLQAVEITRVHVSAMDDEAVEAVSYTHLLLSSSANGDHRSVLR